MAEFNPDDLFFDLEIRGNIFVNSQLYPNQKKIIVSFLEEIKDPEDDDDTPIDYRIDNQPVSSPSTHEVQELDNEETNNFFGSGQDNSRIIATKPQSLDPAETDDNPKHHWQHGYLQDYYLNGPDDYKVQNNQMALDKIAQHIKNVAKSVKDYTIEFENLNILKDYLAFAKRYGVIINHSQRNDSANRKSLKEFSVPYDTDNGFDPTQPGNGLRIGYNSLNYDQTMIAKLLGDFTNTPNPFGKQTSIVKLALDYKYESPTQEKFNELTHKFYERVCGRPNSKSIDEILSPEALVQFNNKMFEEKNMSDALGGFSFDDDNKNPGQCTYEAWKMSNRFIDVSCLNPLHISLKRCAMALGYKIQESDSNREPTAPIESFNDMADLFAYNVNDIYVTMKLFESGSYYNRFIQNKQLLKEFPYLIYAQTEEAQQGRSEKKIEWNTGEDSLRYSRLTINDTSTKFVTNVIAPYKNTKIEDNKTLNLVYPDAKIAKELDAQGKLPKLFHGKPRNIIDYIQDLLDDLLGDLLAKKQINQVVIDKVQAQYQKIKDLYAPFIGQNFNEELNGYANSDEGQKQGYKKAIKPSDLNQKNAVVRYIRRDGNYVNDKNIGLASYINLSIGGTHGVEVKQDEFDKEFNKYLEEKQLYEDTAKYLNEHGNFDHPVSMDNLAESIAELLPEEPFTHVKRKPLEFDETKTYGDLLLKSASRKKPKLREPKAPTLFDSKGKLDDKYSFTSTDPSNHEDFDSYYPSLISQLAIFRNVDGDDVFTQDLYHPRLKFKKMAKDKNYPEAERAGYQLRQLSMKLLVNAASGGGDASFNSFIRCNNKMMAMRIIGQLFCWYIGQTLALFNARIPSTNTDGLYAMSIDNDLNDELVEACAKRLILKLDPEHLELFVSKDANNRLEKNHNEVDEARGGALTSWKGPSTGNNIDHPAIIDYVLAQYLAYKPDACNTEFDPQFATKILYDFVKNGSKYNPTIADTLRFFQFPFDAKPKTSRYHFLLNVNDAIKYENDEEITELPKPKLLNNTNRVFLIKRNPLDKNQYTLKSTGLQAVQANTVKKRLNVKAAKDADGTPFRDIIGDYSDSIAMNVIKENDPRTFERKIMNGSYDHTATVAEEKPRDLKIIKIKYFTNNQTIKLYNEDLHDVDEAEFKDILHILDIRAYLDIVEDAFNRQWRNS